MVQRTGACPIHNYRIGDPRNQKPQTYKSPEYSSHFAEECFDNKWGQTWGIWLTLRKALICLRGNGIGTQNEALSSSAQTQGLGEQKGRKLGKHHKHKMRTSILLQAR
jgi:hypothetical protein